MKRKRRDYQRPHTWHEDKPAFVAPSLATLDQNKCGDTGDPLAIGSAGIAQRTVEPVRLMPLYHHVRVGCPERGEPAVLVVRASDRQAPETPLGPDRRHSRQPRPIA